MPKKVAPRAKAKPVTAKTKPATAKAKPTAARAKLTAAKRKPTPMTRAAPSVGSEAPAFALAADDGSIVDLESLSGKKVVLYFYPKDNTPGCTLEACGFRDRAQDFEQRNAVVLGVSRDSTPSHARFKDNLGLPFRLLTDPDGAVIAAYGSWGRKTMMGRTYEGILRTTVLIGEDGRVRKVYSKVNPKSHAEEVLHDLETP